MAAILIDGSRPTSGNVGQWLTMSTVSYSSRTMSKISVWGCEEIRETEKTETVKRETEKRETENWETGKMGNGKKGNR